MNNIGQPEGVEDKLEFQKKHKFAIAFENVSHPGYSTEKIVQAFAAGTVPIYWGDTQIENQFNEKAFINCHRFDTIDEVVRFVKKIDQDDKMYMDMLRTPALKDETFIQKEHERLDHFLYHICAQEYGAAFRRDRVGYGKSYCDKLIALNRMREKNICRKIRKWIFARKG